MVEHRFDDLDVDEALRAIIEGTSTTTGKPFYTSLVESLSRTLNTSGAWVTEYLEESHRLRALAFRFNGEWVNEYEYDIAGTPCELVIKTGQPVHIPENVTSLFPNDPDLSMFGAVSYLGVPLMDPTGTVLGHLAVLDSRPMPTEPRLLSLFRIFADRASAEHQRLRAEAATREREQKLSRLIDSAMDAIVELDDALRVTLMNAAAERMFNCSQVEILGQEFNRFLSYAAAEKLTAIVQELAKRTNGQQRLWIPGGLRAVSVDGAEFPAEATLSTSELHRRRFYTLIIRNVNERLLAERKISELTEEAQYLKEEIRQAHNSDEIIGRSPAMMSAMRDVERVAKSDATVLILGETGTGKELFARAIHNASPRHDKPLIKVNCAALPSGLIESELFGHEKGAFTGATSKRKGRFQLADGGTIFLDEIGELALDLQAKLLRVLQEGEFEPVGSSQTRKVDVRIITATNRPLREAVKQGTFREDLFYRLSVFPITVPPLRDREDDICLLADVFIKRFAQKLGRTIEPLTDESVRSLKAYDWPGNVRELENVIERAVIISDTGRLDLSRALPESAEKLNSSEPFAKSATARVLTVEDLQELERTNLIAALHSCAWRVSGENGAARALGMKPSTLTSRMKALRIKRPQ